jgi:hypothetical protein
VAEETTTRQDAPATSTGTLTQLYLGLVWLGTSMWVAHVELTGNGGDLSGALGSAAAALPGVIAATLVTSASIGQAASSRFAGAARRLLVGLAMGTLFGLLAAAGIRFAYGSTSTITVLAITVGAASVLGGAAAVLPNPVLEAALWGTTWVFFAGVIFGVLQPNLMSLLGAGPTADQAAQAAASARLTLGQSLVTGLIGGVYAFRSLRAEKQAWPWFAIAGALPGALLVAAEALTRLGGSSLVNFVNGLADQSVLVGLSDAARLRHGLIVAAVGGIVALVGAVRTLRTDEDAEPEESTEDDD